MSKSSTTPQARAKARQPRNTPFDRSTLKHIGSHLCCPAGLVPDMTSTSGVMNFINRCMALPIGKNDPDDTIFLSTDIYDIHDHITLHFFSYTRYEEGFFSDFNFAVLCPSPNILMEIDDAVGREWDRLVREKARRDSLLGQARP